MSNSLKTKNIALRVSLKEALFKKWEKAAKENPDTNSTFSGFVNDLLDQLLSKEIFNKKYFPLIQLIGVKGNTVFVKDTRNSEKLIELYLKNDKLY